MPESFRANSAKIMSENELVTELLICLNEILQLRVRALKGFRVKYQKVSVLFLLSVKWSFYSEQSKS